MPGATSGEQRLPVTVTDVLACDGGQLVQYLKQNATAEGFDISSLAGVEGLTKSQRDELADKLCNAALQLERGTDALNADDLTTRLTGLAERDNSLTFERRRWPSESSDRTQLPEDLEDVDTPEASSLTALIEAGGRPACSPQELSHILEEPTTRHTAILSWLTDGPGTETGTGELKTVFSRQLARWWSFRKSQWSNRGLDIDEEGLSDYVAANRRKYERMGSHAMASSLSFNETTQRLWERMSAPRQVSEDQSFSDYKDAVQTRLRPYRFRRLQLKKHPRKQDAWTDWLEYLNFEQWHLEQLTAAAESRNEKFLKSWDLLSAGEPDSGKTRDFLRATKPYKRAVAAVYYQKQRVDWVIKEARAMETEISQKRATAKSNTKKDNRKRRRDDEEDKIPPESQSKRARGQDKVEDSTSGTTDRPQTRSLRRSGRLRTGG